MIIGIIFILILYTEFWPNFCPGTVQSDFWPNFHSYIIHSDFGLIFILILYTRHAIPLFADAKLLSLTFLYYESVSNSMHDINNNNTPINI